MQPYLISPFDEDVWRQFLAFSGWVHNPSSTSGRTSALQGNDWWHSRTSADFTGNNQNADPNIVEPYGMAGPEEDWATVWATIFQPITFANATLRQKQDLLRGYILGLPVM
jgi:hypothetical protein